MRARLLGGQVRNTWLRTFPAMLVFRRCGRAFEGFDRRENEGADSLEHDRAAAKGPIVWPQSLPYVNFRFLS